MTRILAIFSIITATSLSGFSDTVLNDVHSRLNETRVFDYNEPESKDEIVSLILKAKELNKAVSISGGRHAMGGQQFGDDTVHINMSRYNHVLHLDTENGLVTVESGIQWPQLIDWLIDHQKDSDHPWGIRQKQTGADKLSVGGAVSANVHGRGLLMKPMIGDMDSMEIVDANGRLLRLSRSENKELFSLAAGGYGLFGVITEVTLRLTPRIQIKRAVEVISSDTLAARVSERIDEGYTYGDFQFNIDENSTNFLSTGVFSCYRPITSPEEVSVNNKRLSEDTWQSLYKLAHLDKARAFQTYTDFYVSTDGQTYWSDTHQLSYYATGLDELIDTMVDARAPGSLMITELYVPRSDIASFLQAAAASLRETQANVIYGTVRFIEPDHDSFLAWASQPFASVVINLRVTHDDEGIESAKLQFQGLIDAALDFGGCYFLTYHRWARKDQVIRAYPQFIEFLRLKKKYDPEERFQSSWYRHYKEMFSDELAPAPAEEPES